LPTGDPLAEVPAWAVTTGDGVVAAPPDRAFDGDPPQAANAVATPAVAMHILNVYGFMSDLPMTTSMDHSVPTHAVHHQDVPESIECRWCLYQWWTEGAATLLWSARPWRRTVG
jgi:hypothetical protein